MGFGHEKLDVYRAAIEYVGWAYRLCESLEGHRNAKDQARYTTGLDPEADSDPDTDGDHEQTDRQPLPGGDA